MRKILIPLLVIAVIAAAIGLYMYNKPVESLERKKAEVNVSAEQIVSDYEGDENAANEKYLGKVVEVSGKVVNVVTEEGKDKVHLETSSPMSVVICELEEGKEAKELKAGDQANIKGLCTGYLSDVILVQSTVVKK